ncbi:MAG: hypothetical protein J6K73_11265 [Clostridia bacterium]|nr:hypothetical protein [Clostridia bacterium]
MSIRKNENCSLTARLLLWMTILILTLSVSFGSAEGITYESGTLTLNPPQDQLSIRLTPQLLGLWDEYYFIPDAAMQKELRSLLDKLKLLNYTIDAKFWQEHPEAGYTIVDPANNTEWMMLTGNIVLYTMYELNEDSAYMHRRYAECEPLTAYLSPILENTLQYAFFDVTTLTGITSATLTLMDGQTETLTDPTLLYQLEYWFSNAQYMRAPSCPTGNCMLTLTTGTGETVELLLTVDHCPYFSINGIYYDYTPAELRGSMGEGEIYPNDYLFDLFPSISFEAVDLHPLH